MNTTAHRSLSVEEKELLDVLYRQSKFCDGMQINFLSARLGLSSGEAELVANALHGQGLVHYQKYGVLRLTENGKAYVQCIKEAVTKNTGEEYEKSYHYSGLL